MKTERNGDPMPYKSEHIPIKGTMYDRRRKLTPEQVKEIRDLFNVQSSRKVAALFGVSRRTVQFIWDPEKLAENLQRRRERGTVYTTREEHTIDVRNLRRYKHELYKQGKIKLKDTERRTMKQFTNADVAPWGSLDHIEATHNDLADAPLWWHKKGLSQTASGYGAALTTRYKISFEGRLYRVYATCFSNTSTLWFKAGGRKIVIS